MEETHENYDSDCGSISNNINATSTKRKRFSEFTNSIRREVIRLAAEKVAEVKSLNNDKMPDKYIRSLVEGFADDVPKLEITREDIESEVERLEVNAVKENDENDNTAGKECPFCLQERVVQAQSSFPFSWGSNDILPTLKRAMEPINFYSTTSSMTKKRKVSAAATPDDSPKEPYALGEQKELASQDHRDENKAGKEIDAPSETLEIALEEYSEEIVAAYKKLSQERAKRDATNWVVREYAALTNAAKEEAHKAGTTFFRVPVGTTERLVNQAKELFDVGDDFVVTRNMISIRIQRGELEMWTTRNTASPLLGLDGIMVARINAAWEKNAPLSRESCITIINKLAREMDLLDEFLAWRMANNKRWNFRESRLIVGRTWWEGFKKRNPDIKSKITLQPRAKNAPQNESESTTADLPETLANPDKKKYANYPKEEREENELQKHIRLLATNWVTREYAEAKIASIPGKDAKSGKAFGRVVSGLRERLIEQAKELFEVPDDFNVDSSVMSSRIQRGNIELPCPGLKTPIEIAEDFLEERINTAKQNNEPVAEEDFLELINAIIKEKGLTDSVSTWKQVYHEKYGDVCDCKAMLGMGWFIRFRMKRPHLFHSTDENPEIV